MNDPLRNAAWRVVSESGKHQEVARALKARLGWNCTDKAASGRLSQMLNGRDKHHLPADALLDIVRITRRDEFSSLIQLELIRRRRRK
jgi:hypothetical protein